MASNETLKEHLGVRQSKYRMIPIPEAVSTILNEIEAPTSICYARLNECANRILAKDIYAPIDLPRVNTSIMDGYALNFELNHAAQSIGSQLAIYKVINIVTAGNEQKQKQQSASAIGKGEVVYVTTGSALPANTDCVVMVEDTQVIDEATIKMLHAPQSKLQHVRLKGSDIKKGQLLLGKGTRLKACELGILASCGLIMLAVYSKIRVTVLSTGDELKDPFTYNQAPQHDNDDESDDEATNLIFDSNKIMLMELINDDDESDDEATNLIFDSNKIMLMELINESLRNLCVVKDGGIMKDERHKLQQHMLQLLRETDILITSGGVSMGSRDYIKPILEQIGSVKFGRCCIKPGKPATFATVMVPDKVGDDGNEQQAAAKSMKKKLVFALPGNPVSTHVCFKMFVEPAIKKYTGVSSHFNCQHPPISVEIAKDIRMDSERPNYHRCTVYWDKSKERFIGYDTGAQRSSRLLSCKSANCLLRIPQKDGVLPKGSMVKALVIGDLIPDMPPKLNADDLKQDEHEHTMGCNCGRKHAHHQHAQHEEKAVSMKIHLGVLTVSDRASKGVYKDESGPLLVNGLKQSVFGEHNVDKIETQIVSDDAHEIEEVLKQWDEASSCHLIVTTGGTGFGARDNTPEVSKKLIEKECAGLVHRMMQYGLQHTSFACLSRYTAGITKNKTLIINMPGSSKAVQQCLDAIKDVLPHALNQINQPQSQ
eukprot:CAMPEP_0197074520 /NCGR_PEP_ID=MMETSP1384-20130603/211146_1 /TAXON_ID=29189 /ORGANISM="Ammonia sp." /LENGTH=711 /DNA_ID=CAMNT_0042513361 /DNA_START=30 /DNA_END=2166 /DNA_ORIENTATION=-